MRIRMLRRPRETCIDGVRLDHFEAGVEYELGGSLAALFLAEGWAGPVGPSDPTAPPSQDRVSLSDDNKASLRSPRRSDLAREQYARVTEPARAHDRQRLSRRPKKPASTRHSPKRG